MTFTSRCKLFNFSVESEFGKTLTIISILLLIKWYTQNNYTTTATSNNVYFVAIKLYREMLMYIYFDA